MKKPLSLSLVLWLLVGIPSAFLTCFLAYSGYRYSLEWEQQLRLEIVDQAEELARRVEVEIERVEGTLTTLSQSESIQSGDLKRFYAYSQRVQQQSTNLAAISLVDRNDRVVFLSFAPMPVDVMAAQANSVHEVFASGLSTLSKPFRSPIRDTMVIALNVPVIRNGQVVYCLRGIVRIEALSKLVQTLTLPEGWLAGIYDQDGIIVARNKFADRYVGQPASATLLKAMANKRRGTWPGMTREGRKSLTATNPVGKWKWAVAVAVPEDLLIGPLRQDMLRLLVITLGLIVVLALTVYFLARAITTKLQGIVEDARHMVSSGIGPSTTTGIQELDALRLSLIQVDLYRQVIEEQVRKRTQALTLAQERLIDFAKKQEDMIEQERLRISREVHDQIGALFTGISMLIGGLPRSALTDAQRKLLEESLHQGVTLARRITSELRPPLLDDLGFQAAIESLAASQLEAAGISVVVDLADADRLTSRQQIGCYRIIQEAFTNIVRHAHATACEVTGALSADGTAYALSIHDNGQGAVDGFEKAEHYGLKGMSERARLLGAELGINSPAGRGFEVQLTLPVSTGETAR